MSEHRSLVLGTSIYHVRLTSMYFDCDPYLLETSFVESPAADYVQPDGPPPALGVVLKNVDRFTHSHHQQLAGWFLFFPIYGSVREMTPPDTGPRVHIQGLLYLPREPSRAMRAMRDEYPDLTPEHYFYLTVSAYPPRGKRRIQTVRQSAHVTRLRHV